MQSFIAGQQVKVSIDVSTLGTVSAIDVMVVDENDSVVVARGPMIGWTSGGTTAQVTVASQDNGLPEGKTVAGRTVKLYAYITGGASAYALVKSSYRIVAENRLTVPDVSFQTLLGADVLSEDIPNLAGWSTATEQQRTAALMEAHRRLSSYRYRFKPEDWQSRVSGEFACEDLSELTASEWNSLPANFKSALLRAQVIEATAVLSESSQEDFAAQGVVSITIGESSRTFSKVRPAQRGMSARSLSLLAKYFAPQRIARG